TRHALLLSAHHLIVDGWSLAVILREFGLLYAAASKGKGVGLPRATQFREYAAWVQSPAQRADYTASESWWLSHFVHPPATEKLPAARPRPPIKTFRAGSQNLFLDAAFLQSLKQAGAAHGCTLFTFMFASFNLWLRKLSGQTDLVVGVPTGGR